MPHRASARNRPAAALLAGGEGHLSHRPPPGLLARPHARPSRLARAVCGAGPCAPRACAPRACVPRACARPWERHEPAGSGLGRGASRAGLRQPASSGRSSAAHVSQQAVCHGSPASARPSFGCLPAAPRSAPRPRPQTDERHGRARSGPRHARPGGPAHGTPFTSSVACGRARAHGRWRAVGWHSAPHRFQLSATTPRAQSSAPSSKSNSAATPF